MTFELKGVLQQVVTACDALEALRMNLPGTIPDMTAFQLGTALAEVQRARRMLERDVKTGVVAHGDPDPIRQ